MGLKPQEILIQTDSMNEDLRNGLWTVMYVNCFRDLEGQEFDLEHNHNRVAASLWVSYFKYAIDTMPARGFEFVQVVRKRFFSCVWHEAYRLIEKTIEYSPELQERQGFAEFTNAILKRENSGYRLIDNLFSPITSDENIREVENAKRNALDPVKHHLTRAQESLSDRTKPDYRKSIHESICAVEAICKKISSKENATLAQAIKEIRNNNLVELHEALASGFEKLYGWTSSDAGIRHAMMKDSSLDQEDAIYMLVTCSAFINYLTVKADKAGIKLR